MTQFPYCPKGKRRCRHATDSKHTIISRVGVIKTGQMERRVTVIPLGIRCENDGRHMASELKECPADLALKAPLIKYELSELDWGKRKGV